MLSVSGRLLGVGLTVGLMMTAGVPSVQAASTGSTATITGVVTADGVPIKDGTVTVFVQPNLDALHRASAGTRFYPTRVAAGTTDASGRFGVTPSGFPLNSIEADGTANFIAAVSDGHSTIRWSFGLDVSMQLGPSPQVSSSTAQSALASKMHRTIDLRIDLGKNSGVDETDNPAVNWYGSVAAPAGAASAEPAAAGPFGRAAPALTPAGLIRTPAIERTTTSSLAPTVSSVTAPADYGPKGTTLCFTQATSTYKYAVTEGFASAWSWTGAKVSFTEDNSSTHTLGVAFQDSTGGWSASGSYQWTESSGSGGTVPGLWDNWVENEVNYRMYNEYWSNYCLGEPTEYLTHLWQPDSTSVLLYPILGWSHSIHPNWSGHSGCGVYSGGNMYKQSGTDTTQSAGVGFGPISLSAQAGWNSNIKEDFIFTQSSQLCGSTNSGWVSSPEAEAHQY